jgi:C_GCAxxG_C_C family probable redox protein
MGGKGEVCGAVSGAVLAIGLLYGDDPKIGAMTNQFFRRFAEQNEVLRCADLLGISGSSGDELVTYAKAHKSEICDRLMADAMEILLDILEDSIEEKD